MSPLSVMTRRPVQLAPLPKMSVWSVTMPEPAGIGKSSATRAAGEALTVPLASLLSTEPKLEAQALSKSVAHSGAIKERKRVNGVCMGGS